MNEPYADGKWVQSCSGPWSAGAQGRPLWVYVSEGAAFCPQDQRTRTVTVVFTPAPGQVPDLESRSLSGGGGGPAHWGRKGWKVWLRAVQTLAE